MRCYGSSLVVSALVALAAAAPTKHQCRTNHGAVASEVKECSEAGGSILQAGGNAVDAMIATVLCVGVIGMHHSGIGGGGFALVRDSSGSYEFIDFREMAPAAATETMFVNKTDKPSLYGGQAAGVPGELRGLQALHHRHGVLHWRKLFQPAIKFARHGFRVNEDLAATFSGLDFLKNDPAWAQDFAPNGELVKLGDIMYRKRYADTLEKIARRGPDVFYTGKMAETMVATLKSRNGIMTTQDLANYKVADREPLSINYRGHKITGGSAPSSGTVALSALKIFERFQVTGDRGLDYHRLIEATKFAYGQRSEFGDPSFVPGLDQFQRDVLSEPVINEIQARIVDNAILPNTSFYSPKGLESIETPGTSHLVTTDKSGMSVSLTTTINTWYGSRIMDASTGVIFNNEMDDFSVPGSSNFFGYLPSPSNFIRPGKRPLSSISPLIVESANNTTQAPLFIIGAAGGSRIITSTIQNIVHVVDEGLNATTALALGRWHDQLSPEVTTAEYRFDNGTAEALRQRGHNVSFVAEGSSAAQGIRWVQGGGWEAVAEPRQRASGAVVV